MAWALLLLVLCGAVLQRVSGMGFAMVAGPFLVLLTGPLPGVLLVNLCGALTSFVILWRVRADIDWRRYAMLVPPALIGIGFGAWVVRSLPAAGIEIVIGILVILGMTASLFALRVPVVDGRAGVVAAGLVSGTMSAAAGTSGPAIAVYAVATRWDPRRFAATVQPYFATIATVSLVAKLLFTPASLPDLSWAVWAVIVVGCAMGIAIGDWFAGRVPANRVRIIMIVLAYVGGTATLVRGITGL